MKPKNEKAQDKEREGAASKRTQQRSPSAPSHEEIRQRAYEVHLERGGGHGQDLEDWLQAERELKAKYRATGESS